MKLDEIRENINKIDGELIELLRLRMDCSKQVADYKKQNNMPVFDPKREQDILDSVESKSGEYGTAVKMIFSTIMEQSRALQYPVTASGDMFCDIIGQHNLPKSSDLVKTIACQGVDGAYSSLAGRELYKNAAIRFYESFSGVFDAVARGDVEYGILPVENSWAGSVHEVYDLLIERKFHIAAAIDARISHSLLGLESAQLSSITSVVSHEQALRQCSDFIEANGFAPIECTNTAVAVKSVTDGGDPTIAAIGSKSAGRLYGLDIIAENIASSSVNTTRFIAISKKFLCDKTADKISLVFSLPHTTGSLYRTLARFAAGGLNLTKIESRPIKGKSFEYLFYIDLAGSLQNQATLAIIRALSYELPEFMLLGNYAEQSASLE